MFKKSIKYIYRSIFIFNLTFTFNISAYCKENEKGRLFKK